MNDILHVTVAVPSNKLGAMYAMLGALLGGAAPAALTISGDTGLKLSPAAAPVAEVADVGDVGSDTTVADDGAVDTAGWPWDEALHAGSKGQTKDGLWRMKIGVSRPAAKPGFPKDGGTGTPNAGAASPQADPAPSAVAGPGDDEDEFAAFSAAAAKANGAAAAAAASVQARTWTDADLGALCNQAAVKLNDPAPIRALIAEYVPTGEVQHSRNIPADKREAFAKALEAKAGIEFVG